MGWLIKVQVTGNPTSKSGCGQHLAACGKPVPLAKVCGGGRRAVGLTVAAIATIDVNAIVHVELAIVTRRERVPEGWVVFRFAGFG